MKSKRALLDAPPRGGSAGLVVGDEAANVIRVADVTALLRLEQSISGRADRVPLFAGCREVEFKGSDYTATLRRESFCRSRAGC